MTQKIYVSYSYPEDIYALDMIRGKFLFAADSDVNIVSHRHQVKECQKALILLSEEADMEPIIKDFRKLKLANIPVYITKIHKHQTLTIPDEFDGAPIHEWSLDDITEFCF